MKNTTNQENKGEWDHPYIGFDEAYEMTEQIRKMGGVADPVKLAKALNKSRGGWFALQLASLRRWGLIEGRGELRISDSFRRIVSPRSEGDDKRARNDLFFSIPLFRHIYEKYKGDGLPQEPYFTNVLKDDYGLKGRNPSLVSTIIREFIDKYMPGLKDETKSNSSTNHSDKPNSMESKLLINMPQKISALEGDFPVKIIARGTSPLDMDIHYQEDWDVVESYIKSLKKRWEANNHGRKSGEDITSSDG